MKHLMRSLPSYQTSAYILTLSSLTFAVLIVIGLGHRFHILDTPTLITGVTILWVLSVFLFISALFITTVSYQNRMADVSRKAIQSAMISFVIVVIPAYLLWTSRNLPVANDISTDRINPPKFDVIKTLRSDSANPTEFNHSAENKNASLYYADIIPFSSHKPPKALFPEIVDVVESRGWTVLDVILPSGSGTEGKIEAISFSPWLRFVDDIVIRVKRQGKGSRIDIRSASRYGVHDFGVNAERIRRFVHDLRAIN